MGLTRAEQETIFRWDEDDQVVHIYSASPKTWRKLGRLGLAAFKETVFRDKPSGRFYRLPVSQFRWGVKSRARAAAGKAAFGRLSPGRPAIPGSEAPRSSLPSGSLPAAPGTGR